jgi:pimeloyl-ACP methyl ester carboxylesterase
METALANDFESSGLLDKLAGKHRVIAFDRPGFGYALHKLETDSNAAAAV